jgi:hypothetical protein
VFHQKHMNDDQITFTFNQMFRNEIQSRGFSNGLNKTSIKAQFNRTYRTSCQAWQEVEASQDVELEWVSREMERLDITGSPPTSPISSPLRVQKPAQTRKPSQLVAVVIDSRPQTSSIATRNIFKQSPRSMVTHERTRTIGGEQVPIIRATDRNLVVKNPITPVEAHSPVPELLFRFYDDQSRGVRTRDGEISGRHAYLPCGPPAPPSCADDRMFAAVLCHLNNDETATELISTTSNLFFAMRLAAKSNANPRVYVIRGGAMPKEKVFHLWPYHLRFKAERLYYNGKYMNPASHEYAVWATIPRTAIIHDFAFADLERHLTGNPYMAPIFRVNEMRTKKGNTHIRRDFEKDSLDLTLATIEGIARLMPQFGITVTSPAPVIARLISEIIRSFELDLPKTTPTQWDILGGAFAYALSVHANQTHVAETFLVRAKEAFLSGMRTGIGELNWHLNPVKQAKMIKKGLSLGLGVSQAEADPARLESNKNFKKSIAQFTYKAKDVEPDQVMMDEDEDDTPLDDEDTFVETTTINKPMPTLMEKTQTKVMTIDDEEAETDIEEEHIETEEEAETDIEETILVRTPQSSQRSRISYAREASHSNKKINEKFIIFDCSDDEDYIVDSDME